MSSLFTECRMCYISTVILLTDPSAMSQISASLLKELACSHWQVPTSRLHGWCLLCFSLSFVLQHPAFEFTVCTNRFVVYLYMHVNLRFCLHKESFFFLSNVWFHLKALSCFFFSTQRCRGVLNSFHPSAFKMLLYLFHVYFQMWTFSM